MSLQFCLTGSPRTMSHLLFCSFSGPELSSLLSPCSISTRTPHLSNQNTSGKPKSKLLRPEDKKTY